MATLKIRRYRCSDEEYAKLVKKAKEQEMQVSPFIRKLIKKL